jgi:hypothetical protein
MKEKLHYDDKGSTFKEAFAEARAEGKKTFEWNGEKYNTKLKEKEKASMDEGIPKKTRADEKVGGGYEKVGKSEAKEETRKPTNRGGAAALAGAGVGLGAAAALSGMKRAESARKERELEKNKPIRFKNPIRNISPEEAAWEGEGGSSFKKGGKVSSASSRADGIAQRGKTRGRIC